MVIKFILAWLVCFVFSSTHAQVTRPVNSIQGSVSFGKEPAGFISLKLVNALDTNKLIKQTFTTEEGNFSFENLPVGRYFILVGSPGYSLAKDTILVTDSFTIVHLRNIALHRIGVTLNEFAVTSKRAFIEQHADKTVLNVANSTLAAGNSVFEILQRAPGVTIDDKGNIYLKGKAGVQMLIDGKSTYLSGEQLIALIKTIQGTVVQSIELLSNPSARFDAEGSGGVINIRLKKNKTSGLNGTFNAGAGYGKTRKENTGIVLNYNKGKINFFGNCSYTDNRQLRDLQISRINNSGGQATYFNMQTHVKQHNTGMNYKTGLDYTVNKKSLIGIALAGNVSGDHKQTVNNTNISGDELHIDSTVHSENPAHKYFSYQSINLNYKNTIDTLGQTFSADIDYAYYHNIAVNGYNNFFYNAMGEAFKAPLIFTSRAPTDVNIYSAKADYAKAIGRHLTLNAGMKSSYVRTNNDIVFENYAVGTWQTDSSRSNQFQYTENINAAYAELHVKAKWAEVQIGLRAEQTNSQGNSVTTGSIVNRQYLNLFPSLFINKKLTSKYTIGAAFTNGLTRPDYVKLNPFVYNFDLYTFVQGNPYLNPQLSHSFELSYSFRDKLFVSIGYNRINDVMTDVSLPDTTRKTLNITTLNLARKSTYSLNVSCPLTITKRWNMFANINAYRRVLSTPDLSGMPFSSDGVSMNMNINQSLSVNHSTSIDVSAVYFSGNANGTYFIEPIYWIDLGVKKTFLSKRITLVFKVDDLFNLHKENLNTILPNQHYTIYQKFETRVFRLSASWRFGNDGLQSARNHTKGSESEENRVKS